MNDHLAASVVDRPESAQQLEHIAARISQRPSGEEVLFEPGEVGDTNFRCLLGKSLRIELATAGRDRRGHVRGTAHRPGPRSESPPCSLGPGPRLPCRNPSMARVLGGELRPLWRAHQARGVYRPREAAARGVDRPREAAACCPTSSRPRREWGTPGHSSTRCAWECLRLSSAASFRGGFCRAICHDAKKQLPIVDDRAGSHRHGILDAAGDRGRDLAPADLVVERPLG